MTTTTTAFEGVYRYDESSRIEKSFSPVADQGSRWRLQVEIRFGTGLAANSRPTNRTIDSMCPTVEVDMSTGRLLLLTTSHYSFPPVIITHHTNLQLLPASARERGGSMDTFARVHSLEITANMILSLITKLWICSTPVFVDSRNISLWLSTGYMVDEFVLLW